MGTEITTKCLQGARGDLGIAVQQQDDRGAACSDGLIGGGAIPAVHVVDMQLEVLETRADELDAPIRRAVVDHDDFISASRVNALQAAAERGPRVVADDRDGDTRVLLGY